MNFPYYKIVRKVLTGSECDALIAYGRFNANLKESQVGVDKDLRRTSKNIRSSKNGWLHDLDNYTDKVTAAFMTAKRTTPEWDIPLLYLEPYQYAEYNPGDFYDWHKDQEKHSSDGSIRSLSMSLILQSASEGGEFEIADHDSIALHRGDMIVFPSFVVHRVAKVISGQRMSVVGWWRGRV